MDRMSAEGVAVIPRCAECDAIWLPADDAVTINTRSVSRQTA
jgi:hypothetical protein